MATEAGLSIKDRVAMLQANNTNPHLSGPMKSPPPVAHKTTTQVNKAPPTAQNDRPNGSTQENDAPQLAFKLRPTGAQRDGKGVTPIVPNKTKVSDSGGAGVAPTKLNNPASATALSPKTNDSQKTAPLVPKKPGEASHVAVAMRDKSDTTNAPRPPSIQERLAALKDRAGDGGGVEIRPNTSSFKSPTPLQTKFPMVPQKAGAAGSQAANGPPVKASDLAKSIHQAAERIRSGKKVSDVFLRHSDGKRFRKLDVASVVSSDSFPPPKPAEIVNVDLTTFLQAYATAKENKLKVDAAKSDQPDAGDGDMDELYVEAESTSVQLRVRGKGSVKMASSVRVSEIPEFTEEEEELEFGDGRSGEASIANIPEAPEDEYDDCASGAAAVVQNQQQQELEDPDEIYEPLDEEPLPPPPKQAEPLPSPGPADDKKAKKEKEKEKEGKGAKKKDKSKEEANRKEEKERKKKEEEIKKQRSKFGLKEGDDMVGEGVVKNNASAGVFTKDLAVNKGEIVTILRMDNNPAGKWLVQNDQGKLGFVSSSNIEVATPSIRQGHDEQAQQIMSGAQADDGSPEDVYEDLPEEVEEIYEEL